MKDITSSLIKILELIDQKISYNKKEPINRIELHFFGEGIKYATDGNKPLFYSLLLRLKSEKLVSNIKVTSPKHYYDNLKYYHEHPDEEPGDYIIRLKKDYHKKRNALLKDLANISAIKNKSTANNKKIKMIFKINKSDLKFNIKTGKITLDNQECPIPMGTYAYYVCKTIFNKSFGTKFTIDNILDGYDGIMKSTTKHERTLYDAVNRVNKAVEKNIGIHKLIRYKASLYSISSDIFD